MSIEADVHSALAPIVGGRCFPEVFPLNPPRPAWPAIRYTLVSITTMKALCGDSGDESADTRLQLDCVAQTFKDSRELRLAVMAAMTGFDPPAVMESSASSYDLETDTFTQTLDYMIYATSPAT